MKKFACAILAAAVLFGSVAPVFAATEKNALVMGVLEKLGLKFEKPKNGKIGGPTKLKVTEEAIKKLEEIKKENKVIVVGNDGDIKIVTEQEANKIIDGK